MTPATKEWILFEAGKYSDMCKESLAFVLESVLMARERVPGGAHLEIGTRRGGSALLQLMALDHVYQKGSRPRLVTVDPYGDEPVYKGGDFDVANLYGDDDYVAMKKLLAPWPNHVHFLMTSQRFLQFDDEDEGGLVSCQLGFVLLDGAHDAATIVNEVRQANGYLGGRGIIVVDNIDKDPNTVPDLDKLVKYSHTSSPWTTMEMQTVKREAGASQARIVVGHD